MANEGKRLSLRKIAAELEISPAYLSYMVNGKRPWRRDLYQRYMGGVNKTPRTPPEKTASLGMNDVGAGGGSRTHTPVKVADLSLIDARPGLSANVHFVSNRPLLVPPTSANLC